VACASSFPYQWYGLELPSYQGKLLGPTEDNDLPMTVCEPDNLIQGKCVLFLTDEFDRLRSDLVELKERLKACEQQ